MCLCRLKTDDSSQGIKRSSHSTLECKSTLWLSLKVLTKNPTRGLKDLRMLRILKSPKYVEPFFFFFFKSIQVNVWFLFAKVQAM